GHDRTKAKLAHTFQGETRDKQPLEFSFPKDQTARYVQVRTTQSPTWIAWWEIDIRVRGQKPRDDKGAEKPPSRPDKEALQGTWRLVSIKVMGKELEGAPADDQRKQAWVVKGDRITVQYDDPSPLPYTEVFTVRPEKTPKEIDI